MMGDDDDSDLLMAQKVPIPDDDSDSEDGNAENLMSFSSPFEIFPPIKPGPKSQTITLSPVSDSRPTVSNALSSGSVSDMASSQQPIVEDALRARAEQAESAAERLLELVEPEDEGLSHHSALPPSLLKTTNGYAQATKVKVKPIPLPTMRNKMPPVTPNNRASAIMRQAALFEDSPARNGRSTSLLDALQNQKQETGWGLKRKACEFCKGSKCRK
jgi:CLIP-associating protein 1/2